jgi:diguanylate cyclase (GGDEF)-like protein
VLRPHTLLGSLAFRLLLLATVPFVALTVLALDRIESQRDARDSARTLVQLVELRRDVARVYAPKNLERISLEALARVDELGYPRPLVLAATGTDFEQILGDNRAEFDGAIDELIADFGWIATSNGGTIASEMGEIRESTDRMREAIEDHELETAEVAAVFARLDEILADALDGDQLVTMLGDEPVVSDGRVGAERLRPLVSVVATAGRRGTTLMQSYIYDESSERRATAFGADARHAQAVAYYRSLLEPSEQAELDDVTDLLLPLSLGSLDAANGFSLDAFDVDAIRAVADQLSSHATYMHGLGEYVDAVHASLRADAVAAAELADQDLRRTWMLLVGVGLSTVVLVAFGILATLMPLRRLTRRAESISAGTIDPDPLPVRGATDIRALTRTTNEMTAVLAEVERQIQRLADGDAEGRPDVTLPGTLGATLQASIDRLHAITSQLQSSEALASAIVEGAADAIWTIDPDGVIVSANDASEVLTGVPEMLQTGRPVTDYLSGLSGQVTLQAADGHEAAVLVSTSTIDSEPLPMTVVIAHDISERLDFEQQLALQARRDALTGLPNRLATVERIRDLVDRRERAAVLFVDLDGFKGVNDLRGHGRGDEVLRDVAGRLRSVVAGGDLVGRLGGDEFIVVTTRLTDPTDPADVADLGRRLIEAVERPFSREDLIKLSASIGIVMIDDQPDAETVLSEADSALYQAKHRGRRRVEIFDRELQSAVASETETELALRRGIEADELVLAFQPIVDLATNRVDGAEALVRWQRPEFGLVGPNDFIHIAERSSLIIELDRWVLERCCERLAAWRDRNAPPPIRLAVNISGRHLMEGDLVADVAAALERTGADPSMLEIELTETHLLGDLDLAVETLTALRERGVRISIDDFGTGYSAMNHLRHLPIDSIKIDRSFIVAARVSDADAAVVDAVLAIGRSHGLEVVAEGIETAEDLEFVRGRGCDRGQGYYISYPLPIESAEALMFSMLTLQHA